MSKIEWTEATWNPIVGCSVVSPGCTNCYAMRMAHRLGANPATPHYAGTTTMTRGGPVWTGKMALAPESILTAPLRRRKPTTYFVNSMGDLFHEDVPDEWIDRVFAVMALAPRHTFQVLTKRPERARWHLQKITDDGPTDRLSDVAGRYMGDDADCWVANYINGWSRPKEAPDDNPGNGTIGRWPLPNVWLGVSAEDQARADQRIPDLLATPAAVRFVSCEPMLGPVDIEPYVSSAWSTDDPEWPKLGSLDWVIVGGESGPGARPMHPDWARSLRDQCQAPRVPFFFKQWGEYAPWDDDNWSLPDGWDDVACHEKSITRGGVEFLKVGKARAGRLLDGREWNDLPEDAA